jgi:cytoskeletal protein RodZ
MSERAGERPDEQPKVTTEPARSGWSALPRHLGRARTSTVILSVLFLAIGALYLNVRPYQPPPPGEGSSVQQPAVPTTATPPPPTEAPTTTVPEESEPTEPSPTEPSPTEPSPTEPTPTEPDETGPTTSIVPTPPGTTRESPPPTRTVPG